ncbi:OTU domain-containing protein 4 [Geodia barretti]|uniref:OTU domain-containing protein 4 n=1 Tax=Geodia barretti TaxID=519541 RepID=A0AA35SF09_GEOBA|nr:OTU domain-containing protein 4 [Geodia barretti]
MGRKGPKPKTYSHFQVTLDKFLGSKNLCRKAIAKDGSCLFRAVAEQVLLSQSYHHHVRLQCADYISRHRDDFKEFLTVKLDEYLRRLRIGQLWGGEVELVVFSKMYRRSIVVYNQQVNQVQEQIFLTPEDEAAGRRTEELIDPIYLAYTDGNHYDSVYLRKSKGNLAFCQSVVYSLLYEKVFEETLSQATKQRLRNITDADVQKLAMEGDKGDKHLTFLSKTYPLGVLEGMAPNCFSNTSLHVYQRERDCIERQDRDVAAAIQFQIGDKCLVPVPGDSQLYNGEITSSITPNGCHLVCHMTLT